MNTTSFSLALSLTCACLIGSPNRLLSANLPPEPSAEYLVREDVNIITGLYTREYALGKDGVVDYKTARQIVISEYNEYWNTVVETLEFPLFYWHDADHDGQFEMWIDPKGHGCVCDIVPYTPYPE
ncbi:MAG: hypothetical protein D6704_13265 [Nitrospirae bacterium]|nr:MAG: hypothetical protein D6704_13265 [Nitrospirota bacterium]